MPRFWRRKLFSVNGEKIKHTVSDDAQQDRTHPVFYTLQEEWEKCVQTIQNLPARHALVKTQGRGARVIRTIDVQDRACTAEAFEVLKKYLAERTGTPCNLAGRESGHLELEHKHEEGQGAVFWELFR